MNTGRWLILLIFGTAVAASASAWISRYYRSDAVLALWGPKSLDLIANAPEVEAHRVSSSTDSEELDVTDAPGMLNMRYLLGSDFAYDLTIPAERPTPAWRLDFHRRDGTCSLEFDAACTVALDPATGKAARLVPPAAENLHAFFTEQFAREDER